jgi:hypothetical protein
MTKYLKYRIPCMVPFSDQDTHTHTQIIFQVISNTFTLFLCKNKIKMT